MKLHFMLLAALGCAWAGVPALEVCAEEAPPFHENLGKLKAGDVMPDFEALTAEGRPAKFSDYAQGKTVVLGYWLAGQGGPETMMTRWELLSQKYREAGVVFIGLGARESREAFDQWQARNQYKFTFPILFDPAGGYQRAAKTREAMTPEEVKIETARLRAYHARTISMQIVGAVLSTPVTIVLNPERKFVGCFAGFGPLAADALANLMLRAGVKLAPEDMPAKIYAASQAKPASPSVAGGSPPAPLTPGVTAPDFVTTDLEGKVVKLSDFKGKIVVLDFWATWCGPCLASLPHTQEVAAHYRDQGVVVLGVCTDDTRAKFEPWVTANRAKYPDFIFAHDAAERRPERASLKLYGVTAIPYQFIIGRDGRIAATQIGYLKGEVLLEAALAKAGVKIDPAILAQAEIDQLKRDAAR